MLLRGMLSEAESRILERSKEERYGSEDAARIHKGYELGVIVKEYSGSFRDISDIVKKNNLNSTEGRKETSLRVSAEVNEIIEEIADNAGVSKIAVVRALLYDRDRQLKSLDNKDRHQVRLRVCEWNINHRKGQSNNNMPKWVMGYILEPNYDIIILTECCEKIPNWFQEKKRLEERYFVFSSSNLQGEQNDVTIAVKKDTISVISTQSFFSSSHDVPDHLEARCKCKETGKQFSVVGMRIHAIDITDKEKCEELELVLNSLKDVGRVIIGGDFNNNRRTCPPREWNMAELYKMCERKGFQVYTPDGASFARDVPTDDEHCFAEDHFIIKGVFCEEAKYIRNFTDRDKSIYKWGRHFQTEKNWDKPGNHVEDPYPDHAVLEGTIII